jgi:hypothetical protein
MATLVPKLSFGTRVAISGVWLTSHTGLFAVVITQFNESISFPGYFVNERKRIGPVMATLVPKLSFGTRVAISDFIPNT